MHSEKPYELKDHVEAARQHVVTMRRFRQPGMLKVPLPGARVQPIEECLDILETDPHRDHICEAAWDLAEHLRCEAERQRRGLRRVNQSMDKAVNDPDVCDPQFQEIEDERKQREKVIGQLIKTASAFESIAARCEEPIAPPPPPVDTCKPGTVADDLINTARRELNIASSDKEATLKHYEWRQEQEEKQRAKGKPGGAPKPAPGEPSVKEYNPGEQASLESAAHVAQVALAESQLAMAESLRDIARNPVGSTGRPLRVQMRRADHEDTPDTPLWLVIRHASTALEYEHYAAFMEDILCSTPPVVNQNARAQVINRPLRLPFPDTDPYRFLKAATEVFMMVNCGVWAAGGPSTEELAYAMRRLGTPFNAAQVLRSWTGYRVAVPGAHERVIPYLALIRQKLGDMAIVDWSRGENFNEALAACSGIVRDRLESPCLLELIWSYWHEEGMLVQTMNAISRRFQNIRTPGDRDPLAMIEIDPLRPLNNFLWGYIQDEQHRLTVVRRAYEYDHHYGLSLVGRAVPGVKGADSRQRFLEAFHQLLHLCTIFYKEDDDTTVIADGFPILNALREVHIILSQGAHNQYGDLPWTARQEMLMQEWLLARGEMREFLPSRIMVAYPEPWMDRVDAMKQLMGWTDTSVMHFRELGIYGERILLGARFNDWTRVLEPERAANWARFWRPEINSYIHAYRAATGVDLAERADATMPSTLLRNRLAAQRVTSR